ncbi:hypothetical protein BJY04DRAFT_202725 [Aspergillus karnatakaensis]|uniref:uncharacterized protein n=1 Tax=Aspergillus karnatakaensis TaxID=1810916 RepID=UPI003CCD2196
MARTKPKSQSNTTEQSPKETSTALTPYSQNFEHHLIDHNVFPQMHHFQETGRWNDPCNLPEIKERLTVRRASLSSQTYTDAEYDKFTAAYWSASSEAQVASSVVPLIEGRNSQYLAGGVRFSNLAPLTDETVSQAKPDTYYGARPESLDKRIRQDLEDQLIPSKDDSLPMAPNFFLDVKGSGGSHAVAVRQACYDGAVGARSINSLQSYQPNQSVQKPVYNNNAYTITSTYSNGSLGLFASHPSEPSDPGGRPNYHMTPLGTYDIADNLRGFREGATVYRNARDWVKEKREEMLSLANGRLLASNKRANERSSLAIIGEEKEEKEEIEDN